MGRETGLVLFQSSNLIYTVGLASPKFIFGTVFGTYSASTQLSFIVIAIQILGAGNIKMS